MRDNLRRCRTVRDAFRQWDPGQPSGTVARHLSPLAALLSGIVGSKSTQLPHIAAQVPNGPPPARRVKRVARGCDNAHLLKEGYFLPSADVWLRHHAWQILVLVMDGNGGGRGGTALRLHVVSQGRALPLAWRVRQAPQGHVPADRHIALVELGHAVIPAGTTGGVLGDGACDGTALQCQEALSQINSNAVKPCAASCAERQARTSIVTARTGRPGTHRSHIWSACGGPGHRRRP